MKLLIVDDDKLVSTSLKTILTCSPDIEVVGIGCNGAEAITLYQKLNPDILLMDIRMTPVTGLEAAEEILRIHENAKILFLTTFLDDEYIIKALHIGAKGYLLKQDFESILPALKAVLTGQSVFGGEIISKIPNLLNASTDHFSYEAIGISSKESDLIRCVADGLSNREIADQLFLSEGTVRNYLSNILEKLDLRDRTQLAIFYYKHK